jgi:hypothetical protein
MRNPARYLAPIPRIYSVQKGASVRHFWPGLFRGWPGVACVRLLTHRILIPAQKGSRIDLSGECGDFSDKRRQMRGSAGESETCAKQNRRSPNAAVSWGMARVYVVVGFALWLALAALCLFK